MDLHEFQIRTALRQDKVQEAKELMIADILERYGKTEKDVMFLMERMTILFDLGHGIGKLEATYAEIHRRETGKYPEDEQT